MKGITMAKKSAFGSIPVSFQLDQVVVEDYVRGAIQNQVSAAVQSQVEAAVADAINETVQQLGRERIGKAIDAALAEGWPITNQYGERTGSNRSLKDRVGEILSMKDSYHSNKKWLEGIVKTRVDEALNKHFKTDIDAARESFKAQVDGVLTSVIKKAMAENLGLKV